MPREAFHLTFLMRVSYYCEYKYRTILKRLRFHLSQDARVSDYVSSPDTEKFTNVVIAADESMSVVPLTLGSRRKRFDEVDFTKHI